MALTLIYNFLLFKTLFTTEYNYDACTGGGGLLKRNGCEILVSVNILAIAKHPCIT